MISQACAICLEPISDVQFTRLKAEMQQGYQYVHNHCYRLLPVPESMPFARDDVKPRVRSDAARLVFG